jgi:hypothetical protein
MISVVASAAAFGFLGSLHCAFMCGPLAVAACPSARQSLPYFAGRLLSYALAGALFGYAGQHAAHDLTADLQRALLFAVAALAFARGLQLIVASKGAPLIALRAPSRLLRLAAALLPRRAFPLGLATGALPCAMLAGAWAIAAATAHPVHGALAMTAFSLATTPALAGTLLAALPLDALRRRWSPALQGALWFALAVLLSARPLLDQIGHAAHHHH